jgi:hypothetical protein
MVKNMKNPRPSDAVAGAFDKASNRADLRPAEARNSGHSLENHYKATLEVAGKKPKFFGAPSNKPIVVPPKSA